MDKAAVLKYVKEQARHHRDFAGNMAVGFANDDRFMPSVQEAKVAEWSETEESWAWFLRKLEGIT